ncbi:MAG: ABC transporter substrate-binding protein [Sagittula sp.]|uniref:ABC transporter substrate-binding protein n=1 Tax=Sagittula sp. TaxID=2038081 RepID=UPI004058D9F9
MTKFSATRTGAFVSHALAAGLSLAATHALAQQGVTDTEILIGQTMPYSGPASAFSAIAKAEQAYFKKVNDEGGVNGRMIRMESLDDGYSPPRTFELTRRLVEQDEVALIFSSLGTAPNVTVRPYLNDRGVPQLFAISSASSFGDYESFPWSMGWAPTFGAEARAYVDYILDEYPDATIAVLYQHDDAGKDYLEGLHEALGEKADQIVAEVPYETTEPVISAQVNQLWQSKADVLINVSTPKFAAQAIRGIHDLGWKPVHLVANSASSISAVLIPAGIEASTGIISTTYYKDPSDPAWADDPEMKDYKAFLETYLPGAAVTDTNYLRGYVTAQSMVQVLRQAGDDLSRENILAQAENLNTRSTMLLDGITVQTSPTDHFPVEKLQLVRFDGEKYVRFGGLRGGD